MRAKGKMNLKSKLEFHIRTLRFDFKLNYIIGMFFRILCGRWFIPNRFRRFFCSMAFSPSYSPHEAYMKKYFQISKDEVFLDIGANIGLYTCFMAKRCKHVYAWEPSPQPFADLLTNVRRFQNVTVFDVALGENFAKLPFYIHSIAGHDSLVFQAGEFTGKSVNIKLVPLDSYESKDKVGLIKIDTEGYEVSVVKGALKTIKKHKPRLIIEIHGPSFREQVNAIKKMLPNYHWKRVYKEKATNIDSFHLVGQPFSGSS